MSESTRGSRCDQIESAGGTEQMRLADGMIAYHDFEDRTAVALGKVMHSRVQGTSGRYAGMTGRMDWQVFGTAVGHNRVPTHIELCRRR